MRKLVCFSFLSCLFLLPATIQGGEKEESGAAPSVEKPQRPRRRARRRQPPSPKEALSFMLKRIDRDNDNEISKQEWGGRSRRLFARANKDDDKDSLNEKEIKGLTEKLISSVSGRVERVFKRLDKDDDGELSEEEFSGYATFTMISRWLTPRTRPARRLQREQETKGEQPRRVRRQRPGREPGRERPVRRGRGARLMQNDADNDRKISKDEFRGPDRFFKRLDQNEDGFIDKEEINNLRNRRGRRPGQRGRRRQEGSPDDAG